MKYVCFFVGLFLGIIIFSLVLNVGTNEKGILLDYKIHKYESEYTSYITFHTFNPELGKHRVRTVRIASEAEMPKLDNLVGTWIEVNIYADGKSLDSINTRQGEICKP